MVRNAPAAGEVTADAAAAAAAEAAVAAETTARAERQLAEQKEGSTAQIRRILGDRALAYDAIKAARECKLVVPNLLGGGGIAVTRFGTMLSEGDGRVLKTKLEISIGQQKTTTASFDSASMQCLCEGAHRSNGLVNGRGGEDGRVAIALVDQAYPPCWPSNSDKACISVLRVEYGFLYELVDELISRLKGRYVAAGSVILMFSATNLAAVGTAAYCEDLISAMARLKRCIGEHVLYLPLPHFFLNGCGDEATIRAAVEVGVWAPTYFGNERLFLKKTFLKANEILTEAGEGGPQAALQLRQRLPAFGGGGKLWVIDGLIGLPELLKPASVGQEKALYETLIEELRSGLALDVEDAPDFDRSVRPGGSGGGDVNNNSRPLVTTDVILVVGGSNAQRLSKAFEEEGIAADLVHIPNMRVIRGTGEVLAERLKEAIAKRRPASIVFQYLDNSVFEALTEEGSRIPPRKLDGRYHFDGDIVVADKATVVKFMRMCRPALNATEGIPTAFIGPMPRYVTGSCCGDAEHMANRSTPGFEAKMRGDLADLNRTVKEFLRNDGYSNIRAMDPWVGLRQYEKRELWGKDPVHILQDKYRALVEGVKITISKLSPKRRRDSIGNPGPDSKRGRTEGRGGRGGGGGGQGWGGGGSGGGSVGRGSGSGRAGGGGGWRWGRGRAAY
jgi:hypothetical protein